MANQSGINAIIARAVTVLLSDDIYGPRLSNCWLPAATFAEGMIRAGHIDASLVIDAKKFNIAMSRSNFYGESMTHFFGSNHTGVFRIYYGRQYFYFFTDAKRQVQYPSPLNSAWKERVLMAGVNALEIPSTRARPSTTTTTTSMSTGTEVSDTTNEDELPAKRQRLVDGNAGACFSALYWPESPEAYQLFQPKGDNSFSGTSAICDDSTPVVVETPQEALECRIGLLKSVHESEDSWRNVVKGRDADNFCSKGEIFEIRQRATFLCLAYQLALQHMNSWTWHDCCKESCNRLNSLGMNQATFYKTIAQWNMIFRKFECFPHPNPYVQCGKRPLPRLLEIFPDARDEIVGYGVKNLATLTIEGVHDFIVTSVIPRLAAEWKKDQQAQEEDHTDNNTTSAVTTISTIVDDEHNFNESFLRAHRLESMSFTTAWRWMRLLGFRYDARRKSFYVEGSRT